MDIGQIISLITAFGIGTIVSAILVFLNSSKRNRLDYITKERSEWRKAIKDIIVDLSDESKKERAIEQLKTQINPYGYNLDIKNTKPYFMKDGHIWDSIIDVENDKGDITKLSYFLELLLKYDWERSKKEVQFQFLKFVLNFFQVIQIIFLVYGSYNQKMSKEPNMFLDTFIWFSVIFVLIQVNALEVIDINPPRNNKVFFTVILVCYGIPLFTEHYLLFNRLPNNTEIFMLGIFLIILEFLMLKFLETIENDYIREIERYFAKEQSSSMKPRYIKLRNEIIHLENKLYGASFSEENLSSITKRKRKLKRKIINKFRPKWYHPKLRCQFYRKKIRISKLVKLIKEHTHD